MGLLLKNYRGHVQSEWWGVASGLPLNGAILHQMVLPPLFWYSSVFFSNYGENSTHSFNLEYQKHSHDSLNEY